MSLPSLPGNDATRGLLYLHAACLIFGGTGLFSRIIPLPASDITFWRSLLAAVLLMLILRVNGAHLRLHNQRDLSLMLGCGLLMGLHWMTYFHSMQVAGVAIGMIALYTYPMMIVLLEPLWRRQRPQGADIALAGVVMMGVALMVPEFSLQNTTTIGVLWGILSAFLFALRNLLQREYLHRYRGDTSMMYQAGIAALVALPLVETAPTQWEPNTLILLVVLGALFTALPHGLFASSLRYLKAKSVALIGCLQPVYGTLLAYWLLAEQPSWSALLGGMLVVGAAVIETRRT